MAPVRLGLVRVHRRARLRRTAEAGVQRGQQSAIALLPRLPARGAPGRPASPDHDYAAAAMLTTFLVRARASPCCSGTGAVTDSRRWRGEPHWCCCSCYPYAWFLYGSGYGDALLPRRHRRRVPAARARSSGARRPRGLRRHSPRARPARRCSSGSSLSRSNVAASSLRDLEPASRATAGGGDAERVRWHFHRESAPRRDAGVLLAAGRPGELHVLLPRRSSATRSRSRPCRRRRDGTRPRARTRG